MIGILKKSLSPETMPNTPLDTVSPKELQPPLIRALELHQKGDFEQALAILEGFLTLQPNHFDCLSFLGAINTHINRPSRAAEFHKRALQIQPANAQIYFNLSVNCEQQGNLDEASQYLLEAIRLKQDYPEALFNLGLIQTRLGLTQQAITSLNAALEINPNISQAYGALGNIYKDSANFPDAIKSYTQALEINPNLYEAAFNLGQIYLSQKLPKLAMDTFERALQIDSSRTEAKESCVKAFLAAYEEVMSKQLFLEAILLAKNMARLDPTNALVHHNLGMALEAKNDLSEALSAYDEALKFKPDSAETYSNKGNTLQKLGRFQESIDSLQKAVEIRPNYAVAFSNLGLSYSLFRKFDLAQSCLKKAIELDPNFLAGHLNLALALLTVGDYENGFKEYEFRKTLPQLTRTSVPKTNWQGSESLRGKTIFLYHEQGMGDSLQFSRYIPLIKELGANIILEVPQGLVTLFKSLHEIDKVIALGDLIPDYDFSCSLMSLPLAFKTNLSTIPSKFPYLKVDTEKYEYWHQKLKAVTQKKIGLVWSGGFRPNQPELWAVNERRNIPLELISKLNIPGIFFVSLQKGEPAETELKLAKTQIWPEDNLYLAAPELNDFSDTAGLIKNLDLIISVDTSTAHLAGALGKPVWLLNRFDSCWRWLENTTYSPWYPSFTLFNQTEVGAWDEVIQRVKSSLEKEFTT